MAKKTIAKLKQQFRKNKKETQTAYKKFFTTQNVSNMGLGLIADGSKFLLGNVNKNNKAFFEDFSKFMDLRSNMASKIQNTFRSNRLPINYLGNDFYNALEFRHYSTPLKPFDMNIKMNPTNFVEQVVGVIYNKKFFKRPEVTDMLSEDFLKDKTIKYQWSINYDLLVGLDTSILGALSMLVGVTRQEKTESTKLSDTFEGSMSKLISQFNKILNGYEVPALEFTELLLKVYIYPKQGTGGGKTIQQASKKWDIVDVSRANTNCLYYAFVLGRDSDKAEALIKDFPRLKDKTKNLKTGICPSGGNGSTFDNIQEVVDRCKSKNPVILYNNQFEKIREFFPKKSLTRNAKPSRTIHIQYVNTTNGGHYVALLPKGTIKTENLLKFKQQIKVENETVSLTKKDNDGLINVFKKKGMKLDENLVAWDLECSPDKDNIQTPYALGMAFKVNSEIQYKSFWGLDCIDKFFNFVHKHMQFFHNYTFYAHNSGKYDALCLMRYYILKDHSKFAFQEKKSCCSDGRWLRIMLTSKSDSKKQIKFQDSLALLSMSLQKACKEYKTTHQKLPETVNHDEITLDNYHTFPQLENYLKHDVLGLYEVLEVHNKTVYQKSKGKVNMTECLTSATQAKKTFFQNDYNRWDYPIYKPPKDIDNYIRNGYFGGRNECFYQVGKIINNVFYYDYTSLYPSESRHLLPYGKHEFVDKIDDIQNFFGFVRCMVRTIDKTRKPLHGVKGKAKLIFPIFENWTELTLFSEEIKLGIKEKMYEYEFIDGVKYQSTYVLKNTMINAFEEKAKAKKEGNNGLALCNKIIANSTYGFWALNTNDKQGIVTGHKDTIDIEKYLEDNSLLSISNNGDYTTLKVLCDIDVKDTSIGIASAITSWSRLRLWKLIDAIESKGFTVYYCDTDSIMTNCNLKDHPELMKEFCPDGTGDQLGSLKNELHDEVKAHYTKQLKKNSKYSNLGCPCSECGMKLDEGLDKQDKMILNELVEKNMTTECFDELIMGGLKFYSLMKKLEDGSTVEICKIKGGKNIWTDENGNLVKLTHNDYKTKSVISPMVKSFKCGIRGYLDEANPYAIRVIDVKKEFKFQYNKANIVDGDLRLAPLIL